MKFIVSAAALAGTVSAGTVSLDLTHHSASAAEAQNFPRHARDIQDRAQILDAAIAPFAVYYAIDVEIGEPPQTIKLVVDTGSGTTWVQAAGNGICDTDATKDICGNPFEYSDSTTAHPLDVIGPNGTPDAPYVDSYGGGAGNAVEGSYFTDKFKIGDFTIANQTLALVQKAAVPVGIMGLSYDFVQKRPEDVNPFDNNTVIESLVRDGAISRRIFSLYLGQTGAHHSELLFGGVDTSRYHDELSEIGMVPSSGFPFVVEYAVNLTSFTAANVDGHTEPSNEVLPVLLDSGAPQSLFPKKFVQALQTKYNAMSTKSAENLVDCAMRDKFKDDEMSFTFGRNATIRVPGSDLIVDILTPRQKKMVISQLGDRFNGWSDVCVLAFKAQKENDVTPLCVGHAILRNAYVVYDADHATIGLAQANFNPGKSDVVEIGLHDRMPKAKSNSADPKNPASSTTPSSNGDDKKKNDGRPMQVSLLTVLVVAVGAVAIVL